MFTNVISLEFRKQRKIFLSGLLLAGVVLFFIFAESELRNRDFFEVLSDIIGYFALFGIAGLVILMGPVAGSQLRTESIRNAEEPLPFSPIQKVFGAYLTSLFYVLIGSILFLGLTAMDSSSIINLSLPELIDWRSNHLEVLLILILQFHLLAFLFAYWINQAVAGAAVATLIVGSEVGTLLLIRILRHVFMFSYRESSWLILILCGIVVGLIGAIVGLSILAKRIERSSRTLFLPGFVVTIVALAGSIFLFATFCFSSYKLQNQLVPLNLSLASRFIDSPNTETSEAFFVTMSGDLVQMTAEKRTVLRNTSFILNPNTNLGIVSQYSADKSSFFLTEKEFGKYEIWKASNDGKFDLHFTFSSPKIAPEFMLQCGDSTCLYSFSNAQNFILFSKISSGLKQNENIEWQKIPIAKDSYGFPTMLENVLKPQLESGHAAKLSDSKKILTRFLPDGKIVQWNLPGVAATRKFLGTIVLPAYEKNGEPYFIIPVSANDKTSFVECLPDGSIKQAWSDSWQSGPEVIPRKLGGGLILQRGTELRAVMNDGRFYGPMNIPTDAFNSWPTPIKIDGSQLWTLFGNKLMKIDLMNKRVLAKYSPLSDRSEYWNSYLLNPTKEGIYFVSDNRICLIDWNGKIRDLASASVN